MQNKDIMNLLNHWLRTPGGIKVVNEFRKKCFEAEIPTDGTDGAFMSKQQMIKFGADARNILFSKIHPVISSLKITDIIIQEPKLLPDGNYQLTIKFDSDVLHRESLDPVAFPRGVDDIILLFTNGYHARNYVYGTWRNKKGVKSKKDREPAGFLDDAVNLINSSGIINVTAQIEPEYKT